MAFNFGAFAGGLATAIQTQQKLNLEEKKYDDDIKASNAKLKQEENKALGEILKQVNEHNKNVSDLGLGMSKAEDETQYNTYASELKAANENFEANAKAQLDNYANTPLGEKMKTLFNGARVSNAEQIEKTTIKDASGNTVETYIPQSMAQDKDNLVLMENGRFGIAQVGQDGKIAGYQPTDIAPIKFKTEEEYGKGTIDVFDERGGKTSVTNKQYFDAKSNGTPYRNYVKPEKATINNTGDKNPTAYTTVGISTLPEVQQQVLVKKGYSLNDKITNSTLAKILEQDNKPESLTQQESKVKNMMQTPEFKETYGNLSESEQKIKAQDKIWNDELERDPSKFKDYGEQISLDFQIKNDLATTKDVESSYDKLSPIEKKGLLKGQKESPEGKDYASNHAGKAKAVLDMERRADVIMKMNKDVLTKGFIVNTWDDAVNSIPDTWVNLSEKEKRTYLNKISTNGAVNDLFFVYLNSVNKGAPSNADMEVMKTIVQGLQSGNIETTQQAVKNFMSQVSNDTKSYYDNNAKSLYAVAKQEYENVSKFKYTAPIKVYGVDKEDKTLPPVNDYEKIAKEQGKVYDPANYEYGLVDGVLKQKLIKKGN